jgi:deoxyuridine 5'-triphosphate nucleotidohydrolase
MGNFVSKQAADRFSFTLHHVSNIPIVFANGASGACNKAALAACLHFQEHEERIDLRVVSLPHHNIILGQPWLEKWNPSINWKTHQIKFNLEPEEPLQIKKLSEQAVLPERKTSQAAGYDLTPAENFTLAPGEQKLINTDIAMAIPDHHMGQLYPRSSAAVKGLSVEGGVIDADYRGPIKIVLRNQGTTPFTFQKGDKPVAQIVLHQISAPPVTEVQTLKETSREGGFGSTDKTPVTLISTMEVNQALQDGDEIFLCEITPEQETIVNAQDPCI